MIEEIIFDLGNVLVQIHPHSVVDRLTDYCSPGALTVDEFFADSLHLDYMAGEYTPERFYATLVSRYGLSLEYPDFVQLWQQIIGFPRTGIEEVIHSLAKSYPLSLLSNTDPLHWNAARVNFPAISRFKNIFLSFEIGCNKPDFHIYKEVLKSLAVPAENCLFFDDTAANVEAARQLGIKAEVVKDTQSIVDTLRELDLT